MHTVLEYCAFLKIDIIRESLSLPPFLLSSFPCLSSSPLFLSLTDFPKVSITIDLPPALSPPLLPHHSKRRPHIVSQISSLL